MAPRAFISHTAADKSSWAEPLATRLRALGIQAFFDKWEIVGGDSLVDKVFDEGIALTDAFVILLSKASLESAWVHAELNAAIVLSMEKKLRLIPVKIDDCKVPTSLRDRHYLAVEVFPTPDDVAKEITAILHGVHKAPPLGPPPSYVAKSAIALPGLGKADSMVLEKMCELTTNTDEMFVEFGRLFEALSSDLDAEQVAESVEMLLAHGYLHGDERTMGNQIILARFNPRAVLAVAGAGGVDVASFRCRFATTLLAQPSDQLGLDSYLEESGMRRLHLWALVNELELQGIVEHFQPLGPTMGGVWLKKRAPLKRWASENCH